MRTSPITLRPAPYAGVVSVLTACALTWSLSMAPGAGADPASHNARVAEHLLRHHQATGDHNATVAEYLLLKHR